MARGRSAATAAVAATARTAIVVRSTRRIPTSLVCSQLADKRGQTVDGSWNFAGRVRIFNGVGACCFQATQNKSPGRTGTFSTNYRARSEAIIHAQAQQV